jgi:hypothetical protein
LYKNSEINTMQFFLPMSCLCVYAFEFYLFSVFMNICVRFHLQGKDIIHYLFEILLGCSGFLNGARSAQ